MYTSTRVHARTHTHTHAHALPGTVNIEGSQGQELTQGRKLETRGNAEAMGEMLLIGLLRGLLSLFLI